MISNEVRVENGYENPVFVGVSPQQKSSMISLRVVNDSSMIHVREALEESNWDLVKAWSYLRQRGW